MMPVPPPAGVDDGLGHAPAELHCELEAHGFLALGAVRLFERREVEQPLLLGHRDGLATGVADQPVDEVQFGTGHEAFLLVGVGGILGHKDLGGQSGAGTVGGGGPGGVARGWHGEPGGAELQALGNGGRYAPGLECSGGVQPLLLYKEVGHSQLLAEVLDFDQGGAALPESHDVAGIVDGKQFGETPHVGRSRR